MPKVSNYEIKINGVRTKTIKMKSYTVQYYAGPYSGKRTVSAEDKEEAIDKVKRMIRREMTLPMYSDGYKVVSENDEDEDEDEES